MNSLVHILFIQTECGKAVISTGVKLMETQYKIRMHCWNTTSTFEVVYRRSADKKKSLEHINAVELLFRTI